MRTDLVALLITTVLRCMPDAWHHSLVCSAGSLGYHALKEMLLSGVPGNTLLIESGDLREVVAATSDICQDADVMSPGHCCLVYTYDRASEWVYIDYLSNMPIYTTHVAIYTNLTCLPPCLLEFCGGLESIDLSQLPSNISGVEDSFLSHCRGLKTIDLTPLSQVVQFKTSFLNECTSLESINLGPDSRVRSVLYSFLQSCESLKVIDLSPLSNVTEIQCMFLAGCKGLVSIDLRPLSNITTIPGGFLEECISLTSIDLTPLSNSTMIHFSFLKGCIGLKEVDLNPLSNVLFIAHSFMRGCTGLSFIDLSSLVHLRSVPEDLDKLDVTHSGDSTVTSVDREHLHITEGEDEKEAGYGGITVTLPSHLLSM